MCCQGANNAEVWKSGKAKKTERYYLPGARVCALLLGAVQLLTPQNARSPVKELHQNVGSVRVK